MLYKAYLDPYLVGHGSLRVLDVGCANGFFLNYCQQLGHYVFGVELTPGYVNYARYEYGIDVNSCIGELTGHFDLISMFHVLEHIRDPHLMLRNLRGILRDNGVLFLAVPSFRYLQKSLNTSSRVIDMDSIFPFPHVSFFSQTSLLNILRKEGFEGHVNETSNGLIVFAHKVDKKGIVPEKYQHVERHLGQMKEATTLYHQERFEEAIRAFPSFPAAWLQLSASRESYQEKQQVLNEALSHMNASDVILGQFCMNAFNHRQWNNLDDLLRRLITVQPMGEGFYFMLGMICLSQDKIGEAVSLLKTTLSINPHITNHKFIIETINRCYAEAVDKRQSIRIPEAHVLCK
jgi:SAM-dependent methyltransferase